MCVQWYASDKECCHMVEEDFTPLLTFLPSLLVMTHVRDENVSFHILPMLKRVHAFGGR